MIPSIQPYSRLLSDDGMVFEILEYESSINKLPKRYPITGRCMGVRSKNENDKRGIGGGFDFHYDREKEAFFVGLGHQINRRASILTKEEYAIFLLNCDA